MLRLRALEKQLKRGHCRISQTRVLISQPRIIMRQGKSRIEFERLAIFRQRFLVPAGLIVKISQSVISYHKIRVYRERLLKIDARLLRVAFALIRKTPEVISIGALTVKRQNIAIKFDSSVVLFSLLVYGSHVPDGINVVFVNLERLLEVFFRRIIIFVTVLD